MPAPSITHSDTGTLDGTLVHYDDKEFNPYEESLLDTETAVDTQSVKRRSIDATSLMLVKAKAQEYMAWHEEPSGSSLLRMMRDLGSFPSRALHSVTSLAQRMLALCNTNIQIQGVILANAAVIQRRQRRDASLAG
jgi:hypothetical protein